MWIWFLQLHFQLLAGVGHLLALNFLQVKRTGRLWSDVHDVELTATEEARDPIEHTKAIVHKYGKRIAIH